MKRKLLATFFRVRRQDKFIASFQEMGDAVRFSENIAKLDGIQIDLIQSSHYDVGGGSTEVEETTIARLVAPDEIAKAQLQKAT